jgi:ATP-dependent DNA ligase
VTFEIKFNGYRCIAVKRGSEVTLFSRNEKVLDKRFQKVVDAIAELRTIVGKPNQERNGSSLF